MEPTCRICYEPENETKLVTPCNCRGSSAFIHEECLERYMEYYPDGICRVCLGKMRAKVDPDVATALATLLLSAIILNNAAIPILVKGCLLVATAVVIRGAGLAGLLSWRLLAIVTGMSAMLILAQHDIHSLISINMILLLIGTFMTVGVYVEMEGIMACVFASIAYIYAVFMVMRILFEMDVWTNIAAMNFIFMGWYTWYMSRQPLFAPVPI